MSKDEYKKLVSIEIKKFINKRIEIRRIYKELQQIKNNINEFIGIKQFKKNQFFFSLKDIFIFNNKIFIS